MLAERTDAVADYPDGLLALFEDASTALAAAVALQAGLPASGASDAVIGVHLGTVSHGPDGWHGEPIETLRRFTARADPGWTVVTRPVYEHLPPEEQLKLYSLDYVAFGAERAPVELLRRFDDADYLRSPVEVAPWGPYERVVLNVDGVRHEVDRGSVPFEIGRGPACQLRINDPCVSFRHARIVYRGREFLLEEDSTNGTYVRTYGEPCFRAPRTLRLRKPGILWLGRPPRHDAARAIAFHFE